MTPLPPTPAAADVQPEPDADSDPRFTFANERTYLAWNRTALALIAGGLAVAQLVKVKLEVAPFVAAIALILFGAVMSVNSYDQWQRVDLAAKAGRALQPW